jgi:hypothetical protein
VATVVGAIVVSIVIGAIGSAVGSGGSVPGGEYACQSAQSAGGLVQVSPVSCSQLNNAGTGTTWTEVGMPSGSAVCSTSGDGGEYAIYDPDNAGSAVEMAYCNGAEEMATGG